MVMSEYAITLQQQALNAPIWSGMPLISEFAEL